MAKNRSQNEAAQHDETNSAENNSAEGQEQEATAQVEKGVVTVTSKKTDREVTFKKNFGDTLAESVQLFGEEVVHSLFRAQATIRCQGVVRGLLDKTENGKAVYTTDQARQAGEDFKPGVSRSVIRVSGDPMAALLEKVQRGEISRDQLMEELNRRLAEQAPSA